MNRLKRLSAQAKRKYVTGWKIAAIIALVIALVFAPFSMAVKVLDNAVATRFGGSFWHLAKKDAQANDFVQAEELTEQIWTQAQIEGAVLLKNEGNVLPLSSGARLCCAAGDLTDVQKLDALTNALTEQGLIATAAENTGEFYGAVVLLSRQEDQKNINILTQPEKTLLQGLADRKTAGKLQKIIVLLDTVSPMLLDFLKDDPYSIDAVLWTGGGSADAAAKLLAGQNPSGAAANIWCYDKNIDLAVDNGVCREGIYVGYKYYETRYEDFVMGTEKTGDFTYKNEVAYPFGFGLGYTAFDHTDMTVVYDPETDRFAVTVTVTNTGSAAGKETVQVYAQSPYTDYDKQYGVEKAAVNLVGFAKTAELAPGSSETVTVHVDKRELASYDAYGTGTYILDAGDYYLTVATDAHNATNNILAAKGYTMESTEGRMDADGNVALTYKWVQDSFDSKSYAAAKNGAAISNKLSGVDPVLQGEAVTWLSRRDWEGTVVKSAVSIEGTDRQTAYNPGDHATVSMPTMGAKNGLKLYDMKGLPFDDPKWQTLLDQLTFTEMASFLGDAYRWMMPVKSVQAPGARYAEADMPVCEALLTATFDTQLMNQVGGLVGNTALSAGETVLYAFDGSFEDGFLTGKLRGAQAQGIRDRGVLVVLEGSGTQLFWLNEQTAREQYLRGLQYVVEDAPTAGIRLSRGADGLLALMRQEWSCKGMVISNEADPAGGVLAGITAFDRRLPVAEKRLHRYENDPVVLSAMRQACHYNLYALVNSAAMNGIGENTAVKVQPLPLVMICWAVVAVSVVAAVLFIVLWAKGSRKWKKTRAYLDYKTLKNTLQEEKKAK